MQLELNGLLYEVDIDPIKERAREGILSMINSQDKGAGIIKPLVKGACIVAMPYMGLKKSDRNDDPIELVMMEISNVIFRSVEQQGIRLTGSIIDAPQEAPKEAEAVADEVG